MNIQQGFPLEYTYSTKDAPNRLKASPPTRVHLSGQGSTFTHIKSITPKYIYLTKDELMVKFIKWLLDLRKTLLYFK